MIEDGHIVYDDAVEESEVNTSHTDLCAQFCPNGRCHHTAYPLLYGGNVEECRDEYVETHYGPYNYVYYMSEKFQNCKIEVAK